MTPAPDRHRPGTSAFGLLTWIGLLAGPAAVGQAQDPDDDPKPAAAPTPAAPAVPEAQAPIAQPSDHAVVAGYERFGVGPKADRDWAGRLLAGELGCTACHSDRAGDAAAGIDRKQAPILDGVGARVWPSYVRAFLSAPQRVKPGTTMPDPFAGWPAAEKAEAVEAITHWLATTGSPADAKADSRAVGRGRWLYQTVGCVACHGGPGEQAARPAAPVPLGDLAAKTTVPALEAFLREPHTTRPSGRMPGFRYGKTDAADLAHFLLRDRAGSARQVLDYRYFEGEWTALPDFAALTPKAAGRAEEFDVGLAQRPENYGLEFRGTLRVDRDGEYTFHLTSDDGGRLEIDGRTAVDNDGVHAPTVRTGVVTLARGDHPLRVTLFNGGNEAELDVELQGPGLDRQPLIGHLVPLAGAAAPKPAAGDVARLTPDPALAARGRTLFAEVGCASCHQLRVDGVAIAPAPRTPAKALADLGASGGCLAESPAKGLPGYALNAGQREALAAALRGLHDAGPAKPPAPDQVVHRNLAAFNCYACHQRDGRGGVEPALNPAFATTQPEMGDEGRLPPHLNGVAAKLNPAYLKQIFAEGAKDRPYMLTQMPRFGAAELAPLAQALTATDVVESVAEPAFGESPRRVKSDGRFLVGGEALGCIKCHTFNGTEAEGVQAIDMTRMTHRLRRDWFHRYVVDPPKYRPGTRMPTSWPEGKSLLPNVLGGETVAQVEAVWRYLADGASAAEPFGLGRLPIPLAATKETVIYRNFIEGGGPRAIGVGYPGGVNLAFDANALRLTMVWQGGFIDAGRHWNGRGEGFQRPMGGNLLSLPAGPPVAALPTPDATWPSAEARSPTDHFLGYDLSAEARNPTFHYSVAETRIDDRPEPTPAAAAGGPPGLRRTLTFTAADPAAPPAGLYFRALVADKIEPQPGNQFRVNGEWTLKLDAPAPPVVRPAAGKAELLVPLTFTGGKATVVEEFIW